MSRVGTFIYSPCTPVGEEWEEGVQRLKQATHHVAVSRHVMPRDVLSHAPLTWPMSWHFIVRMTLEREAYHNCGSLIFGPLK